MRTAQTHFNEIGTSRACKILNVALIQTREPVNNVYEQEAKKKTFLTAFQTFFTFIISSINKSDYLQFVPSAFYECADLSSFINTCSLKVYRHTRCPTLITKEHYTQLLESSLLDNDKYLPIVVRKRNRQGA